MIGSAWKTDPQRPANRDPANMTNWRPRAYWDGWKQQPRNRYSPLRLWYRLAK